MTAKINIAKQMAYWRAGAEEDWDVGADLVKRGKTRHGLFFVHLSLEKMLKAHVCKATKDFAPKMHALIRLAETAGLRLPEDMKNVLAELMQYNIAGRYPETLGRAPSRAEAESSVKAAREVYEWLQERL